MSGNIVILVSGGGSNMAAIARAAQARRWAGRFGVRVAAVVSNKPEAGGLALGRELGLETAVVDHRGFDSRDAFDAALAKIGPWSITALLATLVLLFAFQGRAILQQPLVIAMLAVPILIQVFFNSALAYWLNRRVGEAHNAACPSALIGASNFFELAVAAAISLFGFESGAALATVVGVLIEVPVMLLVVRVVNQSKGWYEQGARCA